MEMEVRHVGNVTSVEYHYMLLIVSKASTHFKTTKVVCLHSLSTTKKILLTLCL
jgi:hypothetical protein